MQVIDEKRKYQRIALNVNEVYQLNTQGYTTLASSNVRAAKEVGKDLYPNQGKNFERLVGAASHGKWVWRFLRRPEVPYQRVGDFPLDSDVDLTVDELFEDVTGIRVADVLMTEQQRLDVTLGSLLGVTNLGINTDIPFAGLTSLALGTVDLL